ncbi:MAG: DeoR/GlpR transcriptional regulator [Enterocloster asparagiformis]|nr:DeoR/GlpR transcriptional regulator [Enterocloster asparagiformis]
MKDQKVKDMRDYILQHHSVSLKELCDVFSLSMNTVRRYINEITVDSNIKKVYGGVRVQSPVSSLSTFTERNQTQSRAKQLISKKAAEFIKENDIIYIDSGTTTMHMLDFIPDQLPVTVITNSCHIINAAIDRPEITLISLPGILDRRTLSFNGENFKYLDALNIHKAFMACTGLNVHDGATNSFSAEFTNKKIAVRKADQIYLLVDSTKFGASTLMTYCPLSDIDYVITEKMPDQAFREAIEGYGNSLVLCDNN